MNEDFKLFLWLAAIFIVLPLVGLGVSEWRKQDCKIELVKAGKSIEEIQTICK